MRGRGSRILLLGTVAALAFGSVVTEFVIQPARAGASLSQQAAPNSAPTSFADTIDRVKGAVVSVQVKLDAGAQDDEAAAAPDGQPGDPLEHFFKRFGEGQGPMGGPESVSTAAVRRLARASSFRRTDMSSPTITWLRKLIRSPTSRSTTARTLAGKGRLAQTKKTDLALLKISEPGRILKYVRSSASKTPPRVGDWVIAVGNPFWSRRLQSLQVLFRRAAATLREGPER